MNALMQFLQAASNAAASNVSGPVDLLAMGLRKMGVPVPQNALMSSQWMAEKGLTKPVPQGLPQMAGETFGMVAPIAAAAKAPQIAAAGNRMVENALIPRQMNPQAGAIVWHGSPHKFDRFDSSKIGTGEGAQAYGHGIYVADAQDVAGSYAQSVKANSSELTKRGAAFGLPEDVASNLVAALQSGKKFDPLMDSARSMLDDPLTSAAQRQAAKRLLDHEMAAYNAWSDWSKPGNLYKVDLPDSAIARMLDWDKPLSQQAPEVQAAVSQVMEKRAAAAEAQRLAMNAQYPARTTHPLLGKIANKPRTAFDYKGEAAVTELVKELGGPDKAAAYFREQGIPGIRYLDGDSRGAGAGTSNYVVFPGEESLLKILERNGVPLK